MVFPLPLLAPVIEFGAFTVQELMVFMVLEKICISVVSPEQIVSFTLLNESIGVGLT